MTSQTPMLYTLDALTLPLSGLQLIEASAGTGKTWTLAALYVRLVLGHRPDTDQPGAGLYPPQILVMTFTDAATAELRQRIRERLALSAHYFKTGSPELADDFLRQLGAQISPEQWPQCAYRLDMAAQWMDDAAIFTIHGWSSRMLKTHAFDSASLFEQNLVEDTQKMQLRAVQDYWRHWFYAFNPDTLAALQGMGSTPQELLKLLKTDWKVQDRAPQPAGTAPATPDVLLVRWTQWQQQLAPLEATARQGWTPALVQTLNDAAVARSFKGVSLGNFAKWMDQMQTWAQGDEIELKTLARFTDSALMDKGWAKAADWPIFGHIEALHTHLQADPQVLTALRRHAAWEVDRTYQQAKAQLAQFDFSDLLRNLYHALQAPDGRLAAAIAAEYPVALVDEFQDTDPWQFGSLEKIYSSLRNRDGGCSQISPHFGLIMIGDTKQAIYSFRGADLATYLKAREQAQGIYTLPGNYRSTVGVVAAVNRIFGLASTPFGQVPFVPVSACNDQVQPLQIKGQTQVAMTVWHLPFDKTPRKSDFMAAMAAVFASQMVALLQSGSVRSGDMAVLVRDWMEAAAMREALAVRGVRSVYLSDRNSVYESQQASDLWRILQAVTRPGSNRLVRAALATGTWSLATGALDALLADEAGWDAQVEQFMHWQQVWRTQGFLPMLQRLLHDQGLASRLLHSPAQGERALTNLLHLGELLQTMSLELQGEGALLRYLEAQLRCPKTSGEAAQLRLESDAHLVQVVTLHKAKGLEYPLVFLPFVSLYKAESSKGERPDAERLAEDIRLLYVALTRARQALWLGAAQVHGDVTGKTPTVKSALSALLGRLLVGDLRERLDAWACADIAVLTAPEPTQAYWQPPQTPATFQPARTPQRRMGLRWWSASFSALTRGLLSGTAQRTDEALADAPTALADSRDERLADAQLDAQRWPDDADLPAGREADSFEPPPHWLEGDDFDAAFDAAAVTVAETNLNRYDSFPAGSSYGILLHDLLEWQAQRDWPAARLPAPHEAPATVAPESAPEAPAEPVMPESVPAPPTPWEGLLARHSLRLGLAPEHSALLTGWIWQILMTNLPLAPVSHAQAALQIGALKAADRWPEMAFTLPVQRLSSQWLDQLITRQVWPGAARPALPWHQLEGLLTGIMDLVFEHQGRYFVLDYKSNRLDGYGPAQLQQAMLAHRYDVQALLYLLALHRLLQSRLPDYDYDRHVGGALYLFLRGIDLPGAGLLQLQPPRSLIEALDAAFRQTRMLEAA